MARRLLMLCVAVLLMLSCSVSTLAAEFDPEQTGSVTVTLTEQSQKTPIAGAKLNMYYVAEVTCNSEGKLIYAYTEDFANTGIDLEDPQLAEKLDSYLAEGSVPATMLQTNAAGKASCAGLPLGLYFIRQTNTVEGFAPCTPFLVTVPALQGDAYVYAVDATPKTEVAKLTSITVKKVWNTDASTEASESVTVELLKGDKVVKTAVLNRENNWQMTFTDMPESDEYSIREVDIPKGFTATYQRKGYVFTVTNTSTLIQTGQLVWPIPVLGIAGILLIWVGAMLLRKKRDHHA